MDALPAKQNNSLSRGEADACPAVNQRPVAFAAGCFCIGILAAYSTEGLWRLPVIAAAAAAFLYLTVRNRRTMAVCALFIALGAGVLWLNEPRPNSVPYGMVTVEGIAMSSPQSADDDTVYVALRNVAIDDVAQSRRLRLYMDAEYAGVDDIAPGTRLIADAYMFTSSDTGNEGAFDALRYYLSMGYMGAAASRGEPVIRETRTDIASLLASVRESIESACDRLFGTEAELIKAMLTGGDGGMDEADAGAFRDAGIAHVFALSGLHVGILAAPLLLLGYRHKWLRFGLITGLLTAYCAVCGFPPSLVRASVMLSIGTFMNAILLEEADGLTSMSIALMVTLAVNPYAIFSVGLQLSYCAVLGIFMFAAPLSYQLKKLMHARLADGIALTVSATLGTAPTSALCFGRLPVLCVLINIAAVPLAAFAVYAGAIAVAVSYVWAGGAELIGRVAQGAVRVMRFMAELASAADISVISTAGLTLASVLLVWAAYAVLSQYIMRPLRSKLLPASALLMLAALCTALPLLSKPDMSISISAVYQSTPAMAEWNGYTAVLSVGKKAGANALSDMAEVRGYEEIDIAVVSSANEAASLVYLTDEIPVNVALLTTDSEAAARTLAEAGIRTLSLTGGGTYSAGGAVISYDGVPKLTFDGFIVSMGGGGDVAIVPHTGEYGISAQRAVLCAGRYEGQVSFASDTEHIYALSQIEIDIDGGRLRLYTRD